MVIEPVLREPGAFGFSWLEIQRTKASLLQQLDFNQANATVNNTVSDFGLFPRYADCEHKCPELDACIGSSLWCDGRINCPSGYDESEVECGAARRLLELPGGMYAAFGCVAAACAAFLLFCFFGMTKKRKKATPPPPSINHYSISNHNNNNSNNNGGSNSHQNTLYGNSTYFSSHTNVNVSQTSTNNCTHNISHSNNSSRFNSINRSNGTLKKPDRKKSVDLYAAEPDS